jgi:ABC-type transport system involved in cytochrome c biogenesis permease component
VVDFGNLTALLVKSQLSWVIVGGVALYIRGAFLVSVVLMRLRPKIIIFGVSCLYTTDTTYYWYQLYFGVGCLYTTDTIYYWYRLY